MRAQDNIRPRPFDRGYYYDKNSTFTARQNYRYAHRFICSDNSVTYQQGSRDATFTARRDPFCPAQTFWASANSGGFQHAGAA